MAVPQRPGLTEPREIAHAVEAALEEFLAARRTELAGISGSAAALIDAVSPMLARGKRIRAVLAWWGYEIAQLVGPREQLDTPAQAGGIAAAGASLELLHAAALIHDDIIDNSETRRGLPSLHAHFAAEHARAGFSGRGAEFGRGAAIVVGDLCLGWHEELFASSGLPRALGERTSRQRARMRTDVMAGQYLDILIQAARLAPAELREDAWQVLTYKSAKYSVEEPLLLGAALGGADDALLSALSAFGLPLGQAFQLRDDVLGVFGDPELTGKPAGDDLREGKRTVLLGYALESTTAPRHLLARIGAPDLDAKEIAEISAALVDCGALARTEDDIARLSRAAEDAARELNAFGLGEPVVDALLGIAERIVRRSA